jgi:photosystem II stability/assembly factor-like uncharacterized protein
MRGRRWIFTSAAMTMAMLAGCRGGPGINSALPPGLQQWKLPYQATSRNADFATVAQFESIGPTHMSDGLPTSGKVNAYAVDPGDPNAIYMAGGRGTGLETYSSAGILRTTNGGKSWRAIDRGLTDTSGSIASVVNALWLDPKNSSVLLAATEYDGIFRSSNFGYSWTNVYRTTRATQFAAFGGALFASTAAGILSSQNLGVTWTVAFAGTPKKRPTAFGAVQGPFGSAFYAGMSDGTMYALNSGKWTNVGKLPFNPHTGTAGSVPAVHQIAVDPRAPRTVYASSNDGSWDQDLHASTDGGHTWKSVLKNSYYQNGLGTQAIAFSRVHAHRLYVGADSGFYFIPGDGSPNPVPSPASNLSVIDLRNIWTIANGGDDACWIASDQGLDYEPTCSTHSNGLNDRVVSSTSATGLARRFSVSPNGRTLLVSLQDFSSHLTTDGGMSWKPMNLYEDGFNELRPGDPSVCYAYDEATGLSRSTNGCVSFSSHDGSISPSRLMTTPIAFDPQSPLTMYLLSGPSDGPGFSGPKAVFKSTDGGTTLSRLAWPFKWAGAIAIDRANGKHMIVCDLAFHRSSLWVTIDGGRTWTKSSGVPPTQFWYALTVSPVNGQTILASSVDASNNVFVLRSTDGGKIFTRVATVVNAPLIRGRIERRGLMRHGSGEQPSEQALQEPQAEAFVYSPEREIRYNPSVKGGTPYVALTTLRGAFLSTDNGSTWHRLDGALISHSFWGIRWLYGHLYLGSDGQGVLRSIGRVQ